VTDDAVRFGDPRIPADTITDKSHLFRLGAVAPTTYDGGWIQQAHEDNFPILKGQEASIVLLHTAARRYPRTAPAPERLGTQHRH